MDLGDAEHPETAHSLRAWYLPPGLRLVETEFISQTDRCLGDGQALWDCTRLAFWDSRDFTGLPCCYPLQRHGFSSWENGVISVPPDLGEFPALNSREPTPRALSWSPGGRQQSGFVLLVKVWML